MCTAEHGLPEEAIASREKEQTGASRGKRIIVEEYRDRRLPVKRKHHAIEMEIPEGIPLEELEFSNLTYEGKPILGESEGHWRDYEGHGPHEYQLRGRWTGTHQGCLKHPERFAATWRRKALHPEN
jgi:hypothetical protein